MDEFYIELSLSYFGENTDNHQIDLYDVSQALTGFQRSLAITTHLILNKGEVITQAPALKNAKIYAFPSEEGSWKINVRIAIAGGALYLVTLSNDNPLGHLIYSAYDYVISESLGVHLDYNKSIGQLYEESKKNNPELPEITQEQLDSVIEKCATAIKDIHRPIYKTYTASEAQIQILSPLKDQRPPYPLGPRFSLETYDYMREEIENGVATIKGYVSSYNSNTFKGRVYALEEKRPIPFELSESIRKDEKNITLIVDSLSSNALRNFGSQQKLVHFKVLRITTKSGLIKKYKVLAISNNPFDEK